jgi:outer membrane cobalamin receptor
MRKYLFLYFFLLFTCFLFAQTDSTKTYSLDPITITASKIEIARSLATSSISVISPEEIKAHPDKSVFSLISQSIPGAFVTERDVLGFGVNSSAGQINIRGIGGNPNNKVLTVIDGRPQYMGWYGHPINDSYLSANIERIEVIRGPASTLYGSNAMGGVINIITHATQQEGVAGDASLSYGSYNAQQIGAHVGYQKNDWNVLGSFTREHTDGSRLWSDYSANSGYVKSSYRINEQYKVSIDGSTTKFETFDPGTIAAPDTNNWMHIQRSYVGASLENDYGNFKGGIRVTYNFGHHELDPKYNFGWVSDDHLLSVNAYQSFSLFEGNTIAAGIDFQENGGTASNAFAPLGTQSFNEFAGYVSTQQNFLEKFSANAGVRYAKNNYFGDIVVPQAGITYKVHPETNIRASVSMGYRAPQLYELYQLSPRANSLNPEKLWNYEIGVVHLFGNRAVVDITGFIIDATNIIVDQWYSMQTFNIAGIRYNGVECSAQWFVTNDVKINSNYTFTDKADQTISVPKHKMFLGVEYRWNKFTASLNGHHVRSMYGMNEMFSVVKLKDYTNIEATISGKIAEQTSISVSMRNLLNKSYQTTYGYPMPGRTVFVGASVTL